jgi:hypothetical protein
MNAQDRLSILKVMGMLQALLQPSQAQTTSSILPSLFEMEMEAESCL